MSSICAVSALPIPNSNNNTNGNKTIKNSEDNHSNESQEILNNLKLIKEKIESNGVQNNETNEVIDSCFTNGINGVHRSDNSISRSSLPNKKSLQINTGFGSDDCDTYSEASTLSSSSVTSPVEDRMGAISEAILEQKFSKLMTNGLNSPIIQITDADEFDDDEDDSTMVRGPLLRSTSLKTGRIPPESPQRKKIVRFADATGLDLESVRHIITNDLPHVPPSAFVDLKLNNNTESDVNEARIRLVSALSFPTPNTNGNQINKSRNNSEVNQLNESQEILKNLKLIKEKMESNGVRENQSKGVIDNCFTNGVHKSNGNSRSSLPNNKLLSIQITVVRSPGSFDDDEDDYNMIRPPLLRSTSLKTGKTPPGTPQRKKIVRFADAMGLDLESVRHIISDELPYVPQSAFGGLKSNNKTESNVNDKQIPWFMQKSPLFKSVDQNRPNLVLEFIEPSTLLNFMDRVRNTKVCLENCVVSNRAGNLSINCIIRVLNVSFEKSVTLRYTLNNWLTYNEALASYIPNSGDGSTDKFSVTFSVSAGGYFLSPGQRLLFAIKYMANAEEYWDNNMGLNYSLIYRV